MHPLSPERNRVRGRAVVARRAHNPEVVGSNPAPATKEKQDARNDILFLFVYSALFFYTNYLELAMNYSKMICIVYPFCKDVFVDL